jgi:hypothetical protein
MLPAFHERRGGQPCLGRAEVNVLLTDGDHHRRCDAEREALGAEVMREADFCGRRP